MMVQLQIPPHFTAAPVAKNVLCAGRTGNCDEARDTVKQLQGRWIAASSTVVTRGEDGYIWPGQALAPTLRLLSVPVRLRR